MTSYDEAVIRQEIAVIGALARGLHDFLAGLSKSELLRQSACDAWRVRDVAGHLTNRAERQIASMTRARIGDSGPPPGFAAPTDMRAMSADNAEADIAYTQSLGDDLVPTFSKNYRELHRLLDSFSGEEWRYPCWHPRRGTMTAREYVSQRIQELAVHDWDIRSALDSNAALHPEAIPVLLGMSARWLRSAYNPGDDPPAEELRYHFALSDADSIDVLIAPDRDVEVGTGLHIDPDAIDMVVATPANTYLLLAYGRIDIDTAAGSMVAIGEEGLLDRFAGWMVGL